MVDRARVITDKPIGINLLLHAAEDRVDEVLGYEPAVFSTAWPRDDQDLTAIFARAHERGAKVMHMAPTLPDAQRAAEAGADVIVAQGTEGGGHVGLMGTYVIVRQVARAVAPLPVLAAGGVADGAGLAAALALGAAGALLGTRFLATDEAPVEPYLKDAIVRSDGHDTVIRTVADTLTAATGLVHTIALPGRDLSKSGSAENPSCANVATRPGKVSNVRTSQVTSTTCSCGSASPLVSLRTSFPLRTSCIRSLAKQRKFSERHCPPSSHRELDCWAALRRCFRYRGLLEYAALKTPRARSRVLGRKETATCARSPRRISTPRRSPRCQRAGQRHQPRRSRIHDCSAGTTCVRLRTRDECLQMLNPGAARRDRAAAPPDQVGPRHRPQTSSECLCRREAARRATPAADSGAGRRWTSRLLRSRPPESASPNPEVFLHSCELARKPAERLATDLIRTDA